MKTIEKLGISLDILFGSKEVDYVTAEENVNINKLKEVLYYLRNYTKLKEIVSSVLENDSLKEDFESKILELEERIATKSEELKDIPKVTIVRPRKGFIGEYKAKEEAICKRKNDNARAKRAKLVEEKKREILDLKARLKELKELQRTTTSKKAIINSYFSQETDLLSSKYDSLINGIHGSTRGSITFPDYLVQEGVFTKQADSIRLEVNPKKAKSYIRIINDSKSINNIMRYLNAKKEETEKRVALKKSENDIANYQEFIKRAEDSDFIDIEKNVIRITEENNNLHEMEHNARHGIKNKAINFFRRCIGKSEITTYPKKVYEKRRELSQMIYEFTTHISSDEKYAQAYNVYFELRKKFGDGRYLDLNNLKDQARGVLDKGGMACITRSIVKLSDLKRHAMLVEKQDKEKIEKLKADLDASTEQKQALFNGLREKEKVILDNIGEDQVKYIYETFYSERKIKAVGNFNTFRNASPNTSITALESLLVQNRVSFNDVIEIYQKYLGEDIREEEKEQIVSKAYEVINSIKQKANKICNPPQFPSQITFFDTRTLLSKANRQTVEI